MHTTKYHITSNSINYIGKCSQAIVSEPTAKRGSAQTAKQDDDCISPKTPKQSTAYIQQRRQRQHPYL